MPKDKRSGVSAPQKSRSRPYKARGKGCEGDSSGERDRKEDWIDALCPICLESPHNAVLLICSSHADGCRPYMCNTSYRHSNCLDQYQKTQASLQKSHSARQVGGNNPELTEHLAVDSFPAGDGVNVRIVGAYPISPARRPLSAAITDSSEHTTGDADVENVIIEALNSRFAAGTGSSSRSSRRNNHLPLLIRNETDDAGMGFLDLDSSRENHGLEGASLIDEAGTSLNNKQLTCPLCRGQIFGWRVINAARKYFNDKARSCSHESCMFIGTYQELRVHARCEHAFTRPCDIDPARQRDWLNMERQREIGDVLSTIGGASEEDMNSEEGHWWSYLFLLRLFGSTVPVVYEGPLRSSGVGDHHHGVPLRAGSARLRELFENISQGADGTINTSGSRPMGGEQVANSTHGQVRRQLRPRGV